MTRHAVGTARGMLRNSAALLLVGIFAKGMGLVIAVLVARFLGPSATGLFALLFGIAVLCETLTTLGVPEALVREIAAKPASSGHLVRTAVRIVLVVSILPTLAFLAASFYFEPGDPTRASLRVLSISTPVASLFMVAQAGLQGLERMFLLSWITFATRIVSLVWLVYALWQGAHIESAFVSRLLFQFGAVAIILPILWRYPDLRPDESSVRNLLFRSFPFALNKILSDLTIRMPALILPAILGLAKSGLFDAAERVRNTIAMTMQATVQGIMPAFSRNFSGEGPQSDVLISYSAKYVAIGMALIATGLAVLSGWIIRLLYGPQFLDAILPLQILLWAQVVVSVDAVLRQAMLAARHEYSAVRRSLAGLLALLVVIVSTAKLFGLVGVAAGMLLAAVILLWVDVHFVHRRVSAIRSASAVVAPLSAALLIGTALALIDYDAILTRILVATVGWALAFLVLRLIPRAEFELLRRVVLARRLEILQKK
jgi:O-antigen/teichoic acid export membrane protein